ncbi:hypothetical protein IWW45_004177 [Coemansia sp. RSA 485]|nr:hypothetical protein IWW45_004177 [Coemansia sp. RSA 485]
MKRATDQVSPHQLDYSEDEELVHAMARQYVLDAEAAGSASPSHRSRKNTNKSHTDTSSSDPAPILPPLQHSEKHQDSFLRDSSSNSESYPEEPINRALSDRLRSEEVEDDAYEAKFFVPTRMRYPAPKYTYSADGRLPMGCWLFLLGFLFLPLWWVGAVFPRKLHSDVVRTWRKYNALMSLLSLPLLGLFLALGGWQAVHG